MLKATKAYQEKIVDYERNMNPVVEIDFRPNNPVFITSATASSTAPNTRPADVTQMLFNPQTWTGTGEYAGSIKRNVGWQSVGRSGPNNAMSEWLQIEYAGIVSFYSLYMVSYDGYLPEDFVVEARIGNVWSIIHTEVGNASDMWSTTLASEHRADALRLSVSKLSTPGNPLKLLTFGFPHKILLNEDGIETLKALEEASGDSSSPLGSVTSNELNVTLKNDHKWFTPANDYSPFKRYLSLGVRITAYLGLEVSKDTFEIMPLGEYYTTDWEVGSESTVAPLSALDRIYVLSQLPPVKVPIIYNTTIKYLFALLFRAYGLKTTEYEIDESLTQKVSVGWLPRGNFGASAQALSEAGNCSVLASRSGKIIVKNNFVAGTPVAYLTDDDTINAISNPMSFLKTYNAVRVKYKLPQPKSGVSILSLTEQEFPPGVTVLKDIEFSSGPVDKVENIRFDTPPGVLRVKSLMHGAFYADIEIENTSWEKVVADVNLEGTIINLVTTEFTSKQRGVAEYGTRTFEVNNDLIQDASVAKMYAHALRAVLSDPALIYKISTRGNPSQELFDILNVESSVDGIIPVDIVATRFELTFDGGLDVLMEGKRPVTPTQQVFLNSTHWFEFKIPVFESYYKKE